MSRYSLTLSWQAKAFSSAARSTFRDSVRYEVDDNADDDVGDASQDADMQGIRQGSYDYAALAPIHFILIFFMLFAYGVVLSVLGPKTI